MTMTQSIHPLYVRIKPVILVLGMALLAAVLMLVFAKSASAHGYVDSPASRGYLCKLGQNTNCGAIIYEPQSLEAPKGFPAAGPADGKIASANGAFPELDQQSATRWAKVNMNSGNNTFKWTLTAAHATATWKYYITKPNWDPNQPLARAQFDLTPFCSFNDGGKRPPNSVSHSCNVPARSGYHVILAVWEIADTANAFYNVIDVNFGGGSNPGDTQPPTAPQNLQVTATTSNSISLSWSASTDNVGVVGYTVSYGSQTVNVTGTAATITGLTPDTTYTFTVRARDAAGNVSTGTSIQAKTSPGDGGGSCPHPAWQSGTVYLGGDRVVYNGKIYEAKWWTLGENPELRSGAYDVWTYIGECS